MRKLFLLALTVVIFLAGCSGKPEEDTVPEDAAQNAGDSYSASDDWSEEWAAPSETEAAQAEPTQNHNAEVQKPSGDIVEIGEKLFIAQTNDIYLNPEDYLGKTIKYEGIFDSYYYEPEEKTYYFVIRYGPGCCGYDANAGFEITWDGEYPQPNDWVEAIGVLEAYEEGGYSYLRLNLSSLTVLDERGAEYVSQ